MLCGDLVEAVSQLGEQVVIPAGQQTVNLVRYPPIVQQTLSGGGGQRGGEGQLVQHWRGRGTQHHSYKITNIFTRSLTYLTDHEHIYHITNIFTNIFTRSHMDSQVYTFAILSANYDCQ